MSQVRIGLLRHFEVEKPMPSRWITSQELAQWREEYDRAGVIPGDVELGGIRWNRCLSSDLKRAYLTAEAVFTGPIQRMKELREAQTSQFRTGQLKLPMGGWRWLLRLAWATSHPSQRTAKEDLMARVRYVVGEIVSRVEENTLIVSHAVIMVFLRKELLRLGFTGPKFRLAQSGRLYVFESMADPVKGLTALSGRPLQAVPAEVKRPATTSV
jgi:broad specificity phosphatase PhoE